MELNFLDRFALAVSPAWALGRLQARAAALILKQRHYDAAATGRRTVGWSRSGSDANAVNRPALHILREHARDLCRNNGWARRGRGLIGNGVVGRWGIVPKAELPAGAATDELARRWRRWADKSTQCDADGRLNFYGLQRMVMRTIVESGEVLIRRRRRRPSDGLDIALQLQVLEPDFLDTTRDGPTSAGVIVQGVEFDRLGRRIAYWLFDQHPGSGRIFGASSSATSRRIAAEDVLHIFRPERPGQVRGVSWYAPAILKLKDFEDYADATLMRQRIAACFTAFVTDQDGLSAPLGKADETGEKPVDEMEPGLILNLPPGKEVTFGTPPSVGEHASFSAATLRGIAAALDVPYEALTGDYSQVNFSSARMGRLVFQDCVEEWRWDMMVPQFCDPVWGWAMEQLVIGEVLRESPSAEWTPPGVQLIDPDKEGLAYKRRVRSGMMTPSEMVREQGKDPEKHWAEYAADLATLDELRIKLDSDVRAVSDAGLTQERGGAGAGSTTPDDEDAAA